ncbi:MAG: hypothetical protein RH860_00615 [Cytophagales bacterium]
MRVLLVLFLMFSAGIANGHGGHGQFQDSWLHYISSLYHLIPVAGTIILIWVLYKSLKREKSKAQ